jgi:hypothetical protein
MTEEEKQSLPQDHNQAMQSKKKRQTRKLDQIGNVEFERLEPSDLKAVPVLVQALDNQWLPRSLLQSAFKKGQITKSIEKKLSKAVRAEYIRSLINGQQVIINRAYLYTNPVISRDYSKKKGPAREALKALLDDEVIIPYLLTEKGPVDAPSSGIGTDASFVPGPHIEKWHEVCQEVRSHCVRLSWDDKENRNLTRKHLSERFNAFAADAAIRDIDTYLRDLRLDQSAEAALRNRLVEVGHKVLDFRSQGKLATRNELYKAFISIGDNPAERKYDNTEPLTAEIKQIIDLAYNCNLPDALNGYLITPVDSLPRTALQELKQEAQRPNLDGEGLVKLLRQTVFGLVEEFSNIASMDMLSLQDVRDIRRMDEWTTYIQSLEALLSNPLQFADGGASQVYKSYTILGKRITDHVAKQRANALTSWMPAAELIFSIGGAVLSYTLTGAIPIFHLSGQIVSSANGAVPIVGRLVIRDMAEKHAQQDLSTSIDFMRFRMRDAKQQWKEIERLVKTLPGYQEIAESQNEEIVDPTLSYQEPEEDLTIEY